LQWRHQLDIFSHALQTGQLDVSAFGLQFLVITVALLRATRLFLIWLNMCATRSILCLHAAQLSMLRRNRACSCLLPYMTHWKQQSLRQPCLMLQGFSVADFLESIQKQSNAEADQKSKTA